MLELYTQTMSVSLIIFVIFLYSATILKVFKFIKSEKDEVVENSASFKVEKGYFGEKKVKVSINGQFNFILFFVLLFISCFIPVINILISGAEIFIIVCTIISRYYGFK